MTITVITSIMGGYDTLKPQPKQSIDVDFLCITDSKQVESDGTWKVHYQPPNPLLHPRFTAKVPKCVPWLWAGRDGMIIWMDGSFVLKDEHAVAALLEVTIASAELDVWQFAHPGRDCIYDEATFSSPLPKYVQQPILQQSAAYAESSHPTNWGLWATGFIVYPQWSYLVQERGMRWLTEQITWTNQDQISQPHVWRLYGSMPRALPGGLIVNDFATLHPHLDGT